ncbi:hypothetical protein OSTOST_06916 [Ostertagia ostertagi]
MGDSEIQKPVLRSPDSLPRGLVLSKAFSGISLIEAVKDKVHHGSIVVCEGGTAELVCPRGMVISIALANYGRYSARVCYENEELDDVVPMTQCHNPRTMPTLKKSPIDVRVFIGMKETVEGSVEAADRARWRVFLVDDCEFFVQIAPVEFDDDWFMTWEELTGTNLNL